MTKLLIPISLTVIIGLSFSFCGSSDNSLGEDTKTIQQLTDLLSTKEDFIQALNIELSGINTALGEIADASNDGSDSILDPISKIHRFDKLLKESKDKIRDLEKQQSSASTHSEKELVSSVIKNLKETIIEKENYIQRLKIENDTLRHSNISLHTSLEETKSNLNQQIASNTVQQNELFKIQHSFEQEKKYYTQEKDRMHKELEKAKENIDLEKSNAYFEIALALKDEYDNTKVSVLQASKNKLRKEMINKAYEYFRKACLLGHKSSSSYIKLLITEEQYSKDLTISRSSASISNCGI